MIYEDSQRTTHLKDQESKHSQIKDVDNYKTISKHMSSTWGEVPLVIAH